jgi:hypothetical protein
MGRSLIVGLNKPAYHCKHREEHKTIYKNHAVFDDLELKQAKPPRKKTHQCVFFVLKRIKKYLTNGRIFCKETLEILSFKMEITGCCFPLRLLSV